MHLKECDNCNIKLETQREHEFLFRRIKGLEKQIEELKAAQRIVHRCAYFLNKYKLLIVREFVVIALTIIGVLLTVGILKCNTETTKVTKEHTSIASDSIAIYLDTTVFYDTIIDSTFKVQFPYTMRFKVVGKEK